MAKPNYRMNNRLVSARFWGNEDLAGLASRIPNAKLTMIGLWSFADEAGIFEWKPRVAASLIYPLEPEKQPDVEPAMNAFVETGLLKKIEVDGSWYGVWPNWGEHNSFRKNDSRYPNVAQAVGIRPKDPLEGLPPLDTPEEPSRSLTRPLEAEIEAEGLKGERDRDIEREAPPIPGQEASTQEPTDADIEELCNLVSSYSGLVVKPDWAKYARAILRGVTLEKLKPLLEWMYVESGFWDSCTHNTKNLYDHLCAGNLLAKYNAVKKLHKKKVAAVKAEALGGDPARPEYQKKDAGKFFAKAKEQAQ
jgi:hypothetical protein